jgi:hypothetical protein
MCVCAFPLMVLGYFLFYFELLGASLAKLVRTGFRTPNLYVPVFALPRSSETCILKGMSSSTARQDFRFDTL